MLVFPIVWLSVPATTTQAGRQAGPVAEASISSRQVESRRSRPGQRNDEAGHARPARRGRQSAVGKGQLLQEDRRLDQPHGHARAIRQAAAELHHVLEVPGLEPHATTCRSSSTTTTTATTTFAAASSSCKEGERYNVDNPHLLWDLGWFIGQKIGRADEHVQYRRLFKDGRRLPSAPIGRPTSATTGWSARSGTCKAIDAVDNKGKSLGRKSPRDFYSSPAKSQMNYAEAIEEEGFFDKARRAWIKAAEEWRQFGQPARSSIRPASSCSWARNRGWKKKLADLRAEAGRHAARRARQIGRREAGGAHARRTRSCWTRRTRSSRRSKPSKSLRRSEPKVAVTDREVAERIAREQPAKPEAGAAIGQRDRAAETQLLQYHDQLQARRNYDYWENACRLRADAQRARRARKMMFDARKAFRDGRPADGEETLPRRFRQVAAGDR